MNTKFKRALSSILAFIMVMSCVMVMNVSTALAAEEIYEAYYNGSAAVLKGITDKSSGNATKGTANTTYSGNAVDGTVIGTNALKMNSTTNFSLEFTVKGTASLEAHFSLRANQSDEATLQVAGTGDISDKIYTKESSGSNEIVTLTIDNLPAGTYTVKKSNGGEGALHYLKVVDTIDPNAPSITLEPTELNIKQGENGTINATKANLDDQTIVWTSDKTEEGITVEGTDESATVKVSADTPAGTKATIKATAGTTEATATVTVIGTGLTITADKNKTELYQGQTVTLNVEGSADTVDKMTAESDAGTVASVKVDKGTITVSALSEGEANITVTDTQKVKGTIKITVKNVPVIPTSGEATALVAATSTTTYKLAETAVDAGFKDEHDLAWCYFNNKAYFNNEVAFVGSNPSLIQTKKAVDLNGTEHANGLSIRLKGTQDVIKVKLAKGSIVRVNVTGGGGSSRHGVLSNKNNFGSESNFETDKANYLVYTDDLKSYKSEVMEYTAATDNEEVYISATGDSFITELQVIVQSSKPVVHNQKYVVFGISEAQKTESSAFDIIKVDKTIVGKEAYNTSALDDGAVTNVVYTGVDTDNDDEADTVDLEADYYIAFEVTGATTGIDVNKYAIVFK